MSNEYVRYIPALETAVTRKKAFIAYILKTVTTEHGLTEARKMLQVALEIGDEASALELIEMLPSIVRDKHMHPFITKLDRADGYWVKESEFLRRKDEIVSKFTQLEYMNILSSCFSSAKIAPFAKFHETLLAEMLKYNCGCSPDEIIAIWSRIKYSNYLSSKEKLGMDAMRRMSDWVPPYNRREIIIAAGKSEFADREIRTYLIKAFAIGYTKWLSVEELLAYASGKTASAVLG